MHVELQRQRQDMAGEDSRELLHRLNNQLGVILAHAELLETKAQDAAQKARASQVVSAALQAMAVSRELRQTVK
jgi:two-component sensor histidine kinase